MSDIQRSGIRKKQIDEIKVPAGSVKVVIKTLLKTVDERSKSGIWLISETDTDWREASHAQRWGEVVAVPKDPLPFNVKKPGQVADERMPWRTKVQLSPGMKVWYDYLSSLNCLTYSDEDGAEYKVIDYDSCYVATTPRAEGEEIKGLQKSTDGTEWVIPLNGFHIFERVYHEKKSQFDIHSETKVNTRLGVVKYVAMNNDMYENGVEEDHVNLKVGDRVQFGSVPEVMLEDEAHCHFDGGRMYRRAQARNIDLMWRDGALFLPTNRVLLKRIEDEDVTPGGLILLKEKVKNHTGKIVLSTIKEAPAGSTALYVKGAGYPLEYRGEKCRVVKDVEVLYIL